MGGNMGAKFGTYKYSINENITNYGRNLAIVDRQYRPKIKNKNGKPFTANEKYYKYKCLNCGNEDWILEYSSEGKQHYYIKAGNTYHWCSYALNDDRAILESSGLINRGQKPIFCETNEMYYRDANVASSSLSNSNNFYYVRQIRKSISRNGTYKGLKFIFVSQEDFNNAKILSPDKVVGDFFNITN